MKKPLILVILGVVLILIVFAFYLASTKEEFYVIKAARGAFTEYEDWVLIKPNFLSQSKGDIIDSSSYVRFPIGKSYEYVYDYCMARPTYESAELILIDKDRISWAKEWVERTHKKRQGRL